jgi:hypothetical protein
MAQRFLAPELIAEGVIKQNGTVSDDAHLITRGYLHSNVLNGIHPDSANYIEVLADNGVNKLKVKPLTVTDVTVDATQTSLANFVANVYTGSNFQEGDIVFLSATSPLESYIHNGGTAGTADDWELINSGLSDAQIRSKLSASSGIDYNATTGEFTADQTEIRGFFSAGTGLAFAGGQFSLNATSDQITEGTNNLFYADSLVDDYLTGGSGIDYDAGVISFNGDSDNVSEGTTNLYFSQARSRGALSLASVTGPDIQLLQYNSTTGVLSVELSDIFSQLSAGQGLSWDGGGEFSLDANTDDIAQLVGATNKFYSDSLVDAHLSGGTAIGYNAGVISFNGDSDDVSEGSVNQYFTQARSRDSIQADPAAGNLLSYDDTTGDILVALSSFRKGFQNQSLTANTGLALTHNLGEQLVHVSAMDGSGNKVELEVVYTSSTVVTVKSTVSLTGIDIAVSI